MAQFKSHVDWACSSRRT